MARELYQSLLTQVASEHFYFWLNSLKEFSHAEQCLTGLQEDNYSSALSCIAEALKSYHKGIASLTVSTELLLHWQWFYILQVCLVPVLKPLKSFCRCLTSASLFLRGLQGKASFNPLYLQRQGSVAKLTSQYLSFLPSHPLTSCLDQIMGYDRIFFFLDVTVLKIFHSLYWLNKCCCNDLAWEFV